MSLHQTVFLVQLFEKSLVKNLFRIRNIYLSITTKSKRHVIPGHAYFNRVESFFESHYERGELYFEFLKGDCSRKGELCETCKENGWIGPDSLKRTPRPYPDVTQLPSLSLPLSR